MLRIYRYLGFIFFTAALIAPIASTGCAAHARYYDEDHRDYHRWDDHEDHVYRQYLTEKHEEYKDFSQQNHDEQRDYWNWRHSHPD